MSNSTDTDRNPDINPNTNSNTNPKTDIPDTDTPDTDRNETTHEAANEALSPDEASAQDASQSTQSIEAEAHEPEAKTSSVDKLTEQVAELEQALKETKARANADMYNFQKRIERETQSSKKFAIERFAKALLEVVDNLERAIQAATDAGETGSILDGVTLTHKTLLATLAKHKVNIIDPAGEAFNADLHEAVGMDPEAQSGMVGQVLQKGYELDGRLLRPAMVTVGQ